DPLGATGHAENFEVVLRWAHRGRGAGVSRARARHRGEEGKNSNLLTLKPIHNSKFRGVWGEKPERSGSAAGLEFFSFCPSFRPAFQNVKGEGLRSGVVEERDTHPTEPRSFRSKVLIDF